MDSMLSTQQRASLQRQITVKSPRGAALHPCPSAWQWSPITLNHWQRVHIGVSCEGKPGSLVAQVQVHTPVWSSAHALPKGHRLQIQDLQQQTAAIHSPEDMPDIAALLGMQLRKPLPAGMPVQMQHVERAIYARKGEKIEIRASMQGVTVSMQGVAASTAYQGETIKVRNLSSQQWITGRLIAPGVIEASAEASGGVKVQVQ